MSPNAKKSVAWVWPVSLLAMVVGFFTSVAWISDRAENNRLQNLPVDVRERLVAGRLDAQSNLVGLNEEIQKLRDENTRLQNLLAEGSKGTKELNNSLQDTKLFAGLTEVTGPGLSLVLRDSRKPLDNVLDPAGGIIHDTDVLKIVNEFWNAGAEAIAVNGKRVGPRTNFRCVGSTILVDSVKIATPVRIDVIGDPQTLLGAINLPGGPLDEIRAVDPAMVALSVVERQRLNAYTGTMSSKYAQLPGTGKKGNK
ncbi:MAG TPA: DUF881 domain-containing protein [Fimbriimonadaceae bacterium]|nr:DUF881 domain-containing protein [Fimbriimonadaceae bacterium]